MKDNYKCDCEGCQNKRRLMRDNLYHTLVDMDATGEFSPKTVLDAILSGSLPHIKYMG